MVARTSGSENFFFPKCWILKLPIRISSSNEYLWETNWLNGSWKRKKVENETRIEKMAKLVYYESDFVFVVSAWRSVLKSILPLLPLVATLGARTARPDLRVRYVALLHYFMYNFSRIAPRVIIATIQYKIRFQPVKIRTNFILIMVWEFSSNQDNQRYYSHRNMNSSVEFHILIYFNIILYFYSNTRRWSIGKIWILAMTGLG